MAVRQIQAYVIKTFTINEADTVAVLLTDAGEKVSGIAKHGARLKSAVAGKLEPFNFVEVELFEKEGQKLHPINRVSVTKNSFQDIAGDMTRFFIFSLLSEIVDRTVHGAEGNGKFYRLINHVTDGLRAHVPPVRAVAYFIFWKLRLDGILALPDTCPGCGAAMDTVASVRADRGRFSCGSCGTGGQSIPTEAYRLMKAMETSPLTALEGETTNWHAVLQLTRKLLEHHLGGPLKSMTLLSPMLK